jgi:NAD dependent epimerase/dehydratase family enzyme
MKVVLTGASGLLGRALVSSLRDDGHEVLRLVRRPPAAPDEAEWDPKTGHVEPTALPAADAVINLAGPGLGDRPWTPARKRMLLDLEAAGGAYNTQRYLICGLTLQIGA